VLEVRCDLSIGLLLFVETWHDGDSVSLRRLRADGFQVVDRPRPRTWTATLATNHGGVAAVAVPGIRLCKLDIGIKPESFELLCVRVSSGASSCTVMDIYRTGPISQLFFSELSYGLDRVTTYVDPVCLVGDVNIRIDRVADPSSRQYAEIPSAHGLTCHVIEAAFSMS